MLSALSRCQYYVFCLPLNLCLICKTAGTRRLTEMSLFSTQRDWWGSSLSTPSPSYHWRLVILKEMVSAMLKFRCLLWIKVINFKALFCSAFFRIRPEVPFIGPGIYTTDLYKLHCLLNSVFFPPLSSPQPVSVETPQGTIYEGKRLSGKRVSCDFRPFKFFQTI